MKLEHFLTPYTKINSKWVKVLNVRQETIKLLDENIGKTLCDINHSKILYDPPPRILEIKAKISKWDLMNPLSLSSRGSLALLHFLPKRCCLLRLLTFFQAIFIPACASSSPTYCMTYSAYKLNKQGDNVQP